METPRSVGECTSHRFSSMVFSECLSGSLGILVSVYTLCSFVGPVNLNPTMHGFPCVQNIHKRST